MSQAGVLAGADDVLDAGVDAVRGVEVGALAAPAPGRGGQVRHPQGVAPAVGCLEQGQLRAGVRPLAAGEDPRRLSLLFNLPLLAGCFLRFLANDELADVVAGSRVAGSWIRRGGRGPGREGFGALAGTGRSLRMRRNPRRTRAGVRRPGWHGCCQGSRISPARSRARCSWAWAAMTSQVHRSAAAGSRSFGRVQPSCCFRNRNVCSISKRRRNACQIGFTSSSVVPAWEDHSQTGSASRWPGR